MGIFFKGYAAYEKLMATLFLCALQVAQTVAKPTESWWSHPCDMETNPLDFDRSFASKQIVIHARNAYDKAKLISDAYVSTFTSSSFEAEINRCRDTEWLTKFKWHRDEVLPKEKKFNETLTNDVVIRIINSLPHTNLTGMQAALYSPMSKTLKAVAYFLEEAILCGRIINVDKFSVIETELEDVQGQLRYVLCNVQSALSSEEQSEDEAPDLHMKTCPLKELVVGLCDTMNLMEYLQQLFNQLACV